ILRPPHPPNMTNTLTRTESNPEAVRTFLRRLGHPVCVMGMRPVNQAPARTIIYPVDLPEPVDQILGLADDYHAVYCNLNPLKPELLDGVPMKDGRVAFLADRMIARRTRLLI